MESSWAEVGDRVYVRRHRHLDLNCGLVVGTDACLVIDTRCHPAEAVDLIAAIRTIAPHPWTVVNTHAHWDHCFGNAAFRPAEIWGHHAAIADLVSTGTEQRWAAADFARSRGAVETAELIAAAPIDPPDRAVHRRAELIIGGRGVDLVDLGRGHTDGDLVVEITCGTEASVIFAGDLIEEGNPPGFDDSFPEQWPAAVGRLHGMSRGVVVPGHGAVVDVDFVAAQRQELLAVAELVRLAAQDAGTAGPATQGLLARSPYDEQTTRTALERGLAVRSRLRADRGDLRDHRQSSAPAQFRNRDA